MTSPSGRGRPRHASAERRPIPLKPVLIAVAVVVILVVVAFIVFGRAGNAAKDSGAAAAPSSTASSSRSSSTPAAPLTVSAESLPALDCTGPSYVVTDGGLGQDALLADSSLIPAKYPGGTLSQIPAGCLAGSTSGISVVVAFGPYADGNAACAARASLPRADLKTLKGSPANGLSNMLCVCSYPAASAPKLSGDQAIGTTSGWEVYDLAQFLAAQGDLDAADAGQTEMSAPVVAAVMKFQAAQGLTADGIVGPETWAKIDAAAGCG